MRFKSIETLVFDFDGTLVDASAAICQSFNAALVQLGHESIPDQQIRQLIGKPLRDMFPAVVPDLDEAGIEALIDAYRAVFAPIACDLSRPMPGLAEMMQHFHSRVRMGIATSRMSDGAHQILGAMGWLDHFDVIVGLQDVTHAKPHPESVQRVLQTFDTPAERAVMIGDVPADMQAAKAAGTGAIGMISDHHDADVLVAAGADVTIQSLAELIDLIDITTPSA